MPSKNRECEYCGGSFRGQRGLRSHQTAMHTEETAAAVSCTWCGAEMVVRKWESDRRHYCSHTCSNAWNRYLKQGERHPNYKDGRSSGRGRDYELIKRVVRHRDGACLRCGANRCHGDDRQLHVHHIISEPDHPDPHTFTNLATVCDGCHQTVEQMSKKSSWTN